MRQHDQYREDEVAVILAFALETVDALDPPDDLRGIAFAKAVELRSARTQFWHPEDQQPLVATAPGSITGPNRQQRRHGM